MKGFIPSTSSINSPPNQSYKVSLNNCKNIVLKGGQTATCIINVNDQPAKLIVITKVINDNLGKKISQDFSYTLSGNNKPPTTTFKGVSGKGTTITLNPGMLFSVIIKGEKYNYFSGYLINFDPKSKNPDQRYKISKNNCKNIILKGGQTATCTITLNDSAITPIIKLYHQKIGNAKLCVLSDKEDLGCKNNINLKGKSNPYKLTFPAFKKTSYGQLFQVCLKISSQEKCSTERRDQPSYSIVAPKITPLTAHDKETVKSHGYMEAWVTLHPNGQVDSKINTWNRAHWTGFTGSFELQFFDPAGKYLGKCCYHPYGVNALYLSCNALGICKEDSKSKRSELQSDKVTKDLVDATNSLKIILKHDPNPRWDEVQKEVLEKLVLPKFSFTKSIDYEIPLGPIPFTLPAKLDVYVDTGKPKFGAKNSIVGFTPESFKLPKMPLSVNELKGMLKFHAAFKATGQDVILALAKKIDPSGKSNQAIEKVTGILEKYTGLQFSEAVKFRMIIDIDATTLKPKLKGIFETCVTEYKLKNLEQMKKDPSFNKLLKEKNLTLEQIQKNPKLLENVLNYKDLQSKPSLSNFIIKTTPPCKKNINISL